jgi:hypothetical protein
MEAALVKLLESANLIAIHQAQRKFILPVRLCFSLSSVRCSRARFVS